MKILHTGWKIKEEDFLYYSSAPWRKISIWRFNGEVNRAGLLRFAKGQLGKRYDVVTLFVQALYILSGKRVWVGKKNTDAYKHHVCSELVAWCYFYSAKRIPFDKPWLVTANDIADSEFFRQLVEGEEPITGDVVLINSFFKFQYPQSWLLAPLSWAIRRFTASHWNHAGIFHSELNL